MQKIVDFEDDPLGHSYASVRSPHELFQPLKNKCAVTEELMAWVNSMPKTYAEWKPPPGRTFLMKTIPAAIIERDKVLSHFYEWLDPRAFVVFWMPPLIHYQLHVDAYRTSAINFLLNHADGSDSLSYFDVGGFMPNQRTHTHHYCELVYEPDVYYAFNTQARHAVMNGRHNRYVASIGLPCDYGKLVEHIEKNDL